MAKASGVSIEIHIQEVPRFDGALEFASMGLLPGAAYSNREYVGSAVEFDDDIELAEQDLLFDPQTSGGLLISCPETKARQMMAQYLDLSIPELKVRHNRDIRVIDPGLDSAGPKSRPMMILEARQKD